MKATIRSVWRTLAIAYFPALLLISLFVQTNDAGLLYGMNLLFFFLYSFPFYCVFLEIALTRRPKTRAQRRLRLARLALCVGILLTLVDLQAHLRFALIVTVGWAVLMALHYCTKR